MSGRRVDLPSIPPLGLIVEEAPDPRTLEFSNYLLLGPYGQLPVPRASVDWRLSGFAYGPMGNNYTGDCVIAKGGHAIQTMSGANGGTPLTPTDDQILDTYSRVTGYVRGNPSTDNGTSMTAFANYWRTMGIPVGPVTFASGPSSKGSLQVLDGNTGLLLPIVGTPNWSLSAPDPGWQMDVAPDGKSITLTQPNPSTYAQITVSANGLSNTFSVTGPTTTSDFQCTTPDAYHKTIGWSQIKTGLYNGAAAINEVKLAIDLLGFADVAFNLPTYVQGNFGTWDATNGSWTLWGGHNVAAVGYDAGGFWIISWGYVIYVTWSFFLQFNIQNLAHVGRDWLSPARALLGLDVAALLADVAAVTSA